MPGIEHPDVSTAKRLHHPASRSWFGWRHQQVSVVVHEDVGVKAAACFKQGHVEEFKVISPVIVVQDAWHPIVAALPDVLRYAGQINSGGSRHGGIPPCRGLRCHRRLRKLG
jgi:hypothetical protein